jgi:hypothetical protein
MIGLAKRDFLGPDSIAHAQHYLDWATHQFWGSIILLPIFAVCAALRYYRPLATASDSSRRLDA